MALSDEFRRSEGLIQAATTLLLLGFLALLLPVLSLGASAQDKSHADDLNKVPNPGFTGSGGSVVGSVAGAVPDKWRAFAVGGGDVSIATVPVPADALFPGSPPTNAVQLTVNSFGGDQGFDHEGSQFLLSPGHNYVGQVYLRSANADASAQGVSIAFPVFDVNGFTGRQPGSFGATATTDWALFSGPSFTEAAGTTASIAFRLVNDLGDNSVLIALPRVDGPPPATPEPNYPPLFTPGRDFAATDKYVAATLFHWYAPTSGQLSGPWRPFEGRAAWTGEVEWWRGQIKDMMDANIDVLYVHLFNGFDQQREALFHALYHLRREGYDTPYVAPFLDPLIIWNGNPIDLAQTAGKDAFVDEYVRWFEQYFAANPDSQAESKLLHIGGKIVLNTWHCNPGFTDNIASLSRADVETRLAQALGTQYPSFLNGVYQIGSTNGLPPAYADEIAHQFSNTAYFSTNTFGGKRVATMKAGYWDQNVRDPGLFLPRNGGVDYATAWDDLLAAQTAKGVEPPIYHAYVESWNEYDEGTGIYAGDPGPPFIAPANMSGNSDDWSVTDNPREYIDTTHAGAAQFNDPPNLDSEILWHDFPLDIPAGASVDVRVVVRNTGDTQWSSANGIQLGQAATDTHTWGPARQSVDDASNEIAKYGGVFRGRPVLFEFTITAPAQPGDYTANYQMLQSNGSETPFGDSLSIDVSVCEGGGSACVLFADGFETR